MIEFVLPTPPSANLLYRNRKGQRGMYKSADYKNWAARVAAWGYAQTLETFDGFCSVEYTVPINRRRDLDNYLKALLDSMELLGIVQNDRQFRHIQISEAKREDVLVKVRAL